MLNTLKTFPKKNIEMHFFPNSFQRNESSNVFAAPQDFPDILVFLFYVKKVSKYADDINTLKCSSELCNESSWFTE